MVDGTGGTAVRGVGYFDKMVGKAMESWQVLLSLTL